MPYSPSAMPWHQADWMTTSRTLQKRDMASSSPKCLQEGKHSELLCSPSRIGKLTPHAPSVEGIPAFEELFLYACPKFISANGPPYDDGNALAALLSDATEDGAPHRTDPTHRHLSLFLNDVQAHAPIPKLKSFLRLYTSLGSSKLASFYGDDEEVMIQEMMAMKQASRTVSRAVSADKGSLLDGTTISTSDLNFVIDEVCSGLLHSEFNSQWIDHSPCSLWFTSRNQRSDEDTEDGT